MSRFLAATVLSLVISGLGCYADSIPVSSQLTPGSAAKKPLVSPTIARDISKFELTYFHYDYKESVDLPAKSTETGWMPGIAFRSISPDSDDPAWRSMLLELAIGNTAYNGSLQDGYGAYLRDYVGTTHNTFLIAELERGHKISKPGSPFVITPYIGLGIRDWKRDLRGDYGYAENYFLAYVPLGIKNEFRADRVSVGLDLSLRPMLFGLITVDQKVGGGSGMLGSTLGYKAEAPIKVQLSDSFGMELRGWYEYSAIGHGNISTAGQVYAMEPDSRTHQYGINLSGKFSY